MERMDRTTEFDKAMKKYFYELATCSDVEFNIFLDCIETLQIPRVKARKYIENFIKYVKKERKKQKNNP